jgi:glycosyltransferase involved in cell wall biosynthesis
MISLVIPVYKNAENIPALLVALEQLDTALAGALEVVFVVDGSPDDSYLRLSTGLRNVRFRSQLLLLSRNFGSFSAIRAGLAAGTGDHFAVMAADLQEPPELVVEFARRLMAGTCDVVVGQRTGRADPLLSRASSALFWRFYRRYVQPEVPEGGVDVFGCTRVVRDEIVRLTERHSSLVGLLFWVGFRREAVPYVRRERQAGRSAWTFKKKLVYLMDSVFSFSDLPIKILLRIGLLGLLLAAVQAVVIVAAKLHGSIPVPGYAATVLTVTFFGALNCFGLGVIGGYVWRTFENTKSRPSYIVTSVQRFGTKPQERQADRQADHG